MISYLNNKRIINNKFYYKSTENISYIEEPEIITEVYIARAGLREEVMLYVPQ